MFTLRERIVQRNTTDDSTQSGGRHTLGSSLEVSNLQHGFGRVKHLVIPNEIYRDAGIIFGNSSLVWDLAHLFAQVHFDGAVHNRDQEDQTRSLLPDTTTQTKHDQTLVLGHNANGLGNDDKAYKYYTTKQA